MLSEGEWANRWRAAALGLFGKLVMWGVQNQGMEYSLGKGEFGVIFPNFHFSCIFQKGGRIFVLIWLESEVSRHQVHDIYFLSIRLNLLWWEQKVTFGCRRFLNFSTFLCPLLRLLSSKTYNFLSVWRYLLFFVFLRTLALYKMLDFLPPGPLPPIFC